jgi:hypothetical protein
MGKKKRTRKVKPKDKSSRIEEARQVAEKYASDQREIIKKIPKPPLN